LSGSAFQSLLSRRKRVMMSAIEQLTRKYYCRKRSNRPAVVESSG
jgi:hypothetical protein